jgi:hypothetical protein
VSFLSKLWPQLHAGIEAFGGLIGVALIGIVAVCVLLLADSWMSNREGKDRDAKR